MNSHPSSKPGEIEQKASNSTVEETAKTEGTVEIDGWERLSHVMDTMFRVPGTNIRFGLDPILGLLPGVGDAIAGLISSGLLLQAHRVRVPKTVQIRMVGNILLNTLLGAVPGLGDLFSVWFKANQRNYQLLKKHEST